MALLEELCHCRETVRIKTRTISSCSLCFTLAIQGVAVSFLFLLPHLLLVVLPLPHHDVHVTNEITTLSMSKASHYRE